MYTEEQFTDYCRTMSIRRDGRLPLGWKLILVLLPLAAAVVVPVVRWVLLFCLLCYPIPFIPTHLIMKKKVADPQFRSSVNWGVRFLLSIIYALVIGIVMACCGGGWMKNVADIGAWWGVVAVAWVPIAARLTAPTVNVLRFFFLRGYNK